MGWHGGGGRKRKKGAGKGAGGKGKGGGKAGGKGSDGVGGQTSKYKRPTGPLPERAVLISSGTPALCPKAARESVELLCNALEIVRPVDATADAGHNGAGRTAADLLEAELRELRGDVSEDANSSTGGGAKRRRIGFYGEVQRGVAVLSWPKEDDVPGLPSPSTLVQQVFASRRSGPDSDRAVRFVVRMAPLDFVCPPHLKNFTAAVEAALPKALHGVEEGATWHFAFHARAMSTIKREDALAVVKRVLTPLGMEIDVSEAKYMVVVEVNPSLCGFSVLRDYEDTFCGCNLQKAGNASSAGHDDGVDDTSEESATDDQQDERQSESTHVDAAKSAEHVASTTEANAAEPDANLAAPAN